MTSPTLSAILTLTLMAAGGTAVCAQAETRVPCDTVPPAVLKQAKTEVPHAILHGCVKDKENGKLTYEVETMDNGKSKDMTFDPQGTLIEVEQEIDQSALPAPVSGAIARAANGGDVGKVESVTRNGVIASYETTIMRKGKRRELVFSPEGAPMKVD